MSRSNLLIFPVSILLTLISSAPVFADVGFTGQFNSSTSTKGINATGLAECLGTGSEIGLDTLTGVELKLSIDTGSQILYPIIREYADAANCNVTLGSVLRAWDLGPTTTNITESDKTTFTYVATTAIPLSPNRYYKILTAGGADNFIHMWGAATTSPDSWPYGRCMTTPGSRDCENIAGPTGYGIRDMYFVIFGDAVGTQISEPNPSWNEVVEVTSTSTLSLDWGGAGYFSDSDGSEFNTHVWLFYAQGFFEEYIDDEVEENFGAGTFNLSYNTEIEPRLGKYKLRFGLYETVPFGRDRLVYSTTTVFYVGQDIGTSTGDEIFDDIDEEISKISCSVSSITDISGILKCIWDVTKTFTSAAAGQLANLLTEFFNFVVTKAPWGYAYRVYYIMSNPDTSRDLPEMVVTLPSQAGGGTLNFTPWGYFEDATDILSAATSSGTTTSLLGYMEYWFNLIVGMLFGLWCFHRLIASFGQGDFSFGQNRHKQRTDDYHKSSGGGTYEITKEGDVLKY